MKKLRVSHNRMAEKLKKHWPGGTVSTTAAFDILRDHYKWVSDASVAYMMFHHRYFIEVDNKSPRSYELRGKE